MAGFTGAPGESVYGACSVCGAWGEFTRDGPSMRETFLCGTCKASFRYRHQACVLLKRFGGEPSRCFAELVEDASVANLDVYEPGLIGPLRPFLRRLEGYVTSYYWPGVTRGALHNSVRKEDLHELTFADCSFDLVITSDIFEHVRHPLTAFGELWRVLRPGGKHVFTVPLRWPHDAVSTSRVDTSGPKDRMLLEPVYHGSPTDPQGSLVYTDFGLDLIDSLTQIGFATQLVPGFRNVATFVSVRE